MQVSFAGPDSIGGGRELVGRDLVPAHCSMVVRRGGATRTIGMRGKFSFREEGGCLLAGCRGRHEFIHQVSVASIQALPHSVCHLQYEILNMN